MTDDVARCEPGEDLRGVDGWHWLRDTHTSAVVPYIWNPLIHKWRRFGGTHTRTPSAMVGDGWIYEGIATPPAEVATLRARVVELEWAIRCAFEAPPVPQEQSFTRGEVIFMPVAVFTALAAALKGAKP